MEWQQSFPGGATEPRQTSIEDTYSLALQNEAVIAPNLTFTAGASYDWRDLIQAQDYASNAFVYYPLHNGHALDGQGKLSWRPDAASEWHVSISDRTRFPTLFERFSSRFGGAVSNPNLKPERAVNYEIGGSHQFGRIEVEGAAFYSHLTDTIVNFPFIYTSCTPAGVCTPNSVTQSRNLGHGNYSGVEGSVSLTLSSSLSVGANYTYVHQDLTDPTNAAFHPTDVPTSKGFVYLNWKPVQRLEILPSLDLASNRWTVNSAGTLYYRTGAYANGALRIDYAVTDRVGRGGRRPEPVRRQLSARRRLPRARPQLFAQHPRALLSRRPWIPRAPRASSSTQRGSPSPRVRRVRRRANSCPAYWFRYVDTTKNEAQRFALECC